MAIAKIDPGTLRRLFLFDIDGTLITSGGAGEHALMDAMKDRFDVVEDLAGITLAGATDAAIARKLLAKHSIECSSENITALLDSYLHHLHGRMGRHNGTILPGIIELLDRLHSEPSCIVGLLTGNLERGAKIKLSHYGVWDYFGFGAYADDHHDRNQLGPFAHARAREQHGVDFRPQSIYVIGDTPRDIECGRAFGAKTVAIATGQYSAAELGEHSPDYLFENLSDTDAVASALLHG